MVTIAPWLTVPDGEKAILFYQSAFGAKEVYRLEGAPSPLARLAVEGAEFWVAEDADPKGSLGGGTIRMVLTVPDPDTMFAQAIAAGATEVFPVGEGHGWRLGRLTDPFGLDWELGHPL